MEWSLPENFIWLYRNGKNGVDVFKGDCKKKCVLLEFCVLCGHVVEAETTNVKGWVLKQVGGDHNTDLFIYSDGG